MRTSVDPLHCPYVHGVSVNERRWACVHGVSVNEQRSACVHGVSVNERHCLVIACSFNGRGGEELRAE